MLEALGFGYTRIKLVNTAFAAVVGIAVLVSLSGCASPGRGELNVTSDAFREGGLSIYNTVRREQAARAAPRSAQENQEEEIRALDASYQNVLSKCAEILSEYRNQATDARQYAFWTALVGTVAGAIVVPALAAGSAAKSTIAAWGGVAGATNATQLLMRDVGLSPASVIATREKIRMEFRAGVAKYSKAQDIPTRREAIGDLVAACTAYAVEAASDVSVPTVSGPANPK